MVRERDQPRGRFRPHDEAASREPAIEVDARPSRCERDDGGGTGRDKPVLHIAKHAQGRSPTD
jgi:hypothetical protein